MKFYTVYVLYSMILSQLKIFHIEKLVSIWVVWVLGIVEQQKGKEEKGEREKKLEKDVEIVLMEKRKKRKRERSKVKSST